MRHHKHADMLVDDFRPHKSLRARIRHVKFRTLYADPPWWETGGGKTVRGAQKHYSLMKTPAITSAILFVADNYVTWDSHLYLWVTNNHLEDGLLVMRSVGFRYITTITWLKDRPGLGQYYRGMTEHCLFGVRGRLPYRMLDSGKRAQGRTGFTAPRLSHSYKPQAMRQMIERVSHGPYLELFARERQAGWTCWGDELGQEL